MAADSDLQEREEALERAVRNGSEQAVAALFKGKEYPLRRKLNRKAKDLRKEVTAAERSGRITDWNAAERMRHSAALALLASASPAEATKRQEFRELVDWFGTDTRTQTPNLVFELIRDLRPDWTQAFAEFVLDDTDRGSWQFVFALVRDGLCEPPEHPNFAVGLFVGLNGSWNDNASPWEKFSAHPEILCPQVRRVFSLPEADGQLPRRWVLEPEGEKWQQNRQKKIHPHEEFSWSWILCQAVERGWFTREELIERCLEGMLITNDRSLAKWYGELFAKLLDHPDAPPLEDFALPDRDPGLLSLLGAQSPGVLTWTLGQLGAVETKGKLNPSALVEFLPPILSAPAKGTVIRAIRLLKRVVKRSEAQRPAACELVADALLHENPDVQREVLKFLEEFGDPGDEALQERLTGYAPGLSHSVRKEFEPWMGPLGAAVFAELAEDGFNETETVSVIDPSKALAPFADIDDFITRLSFFWQNPDQTEPGEIGRLFAGFGEFTEDRPADLKTRAGALLKLVNRESDDWSIEFSIVSETLGSLVRMWLGLRSPVSESGGGSAKFSILKRLFRGDSAADENEAGTQVIRPKFKVRSSFLWSRKIAGVLSDYHAAICYSLAGNRNAILLSDPTHHGGWIDPAVLVRRAREKSGPVIEIDGAVALLRLAPGDRKAALKDAAGLTGPFGAALRYALGDDDAEPEMTHEPFRIAAARSRIPRGVCEILDSPQPDAREPAQFRFRRKSAHEVPSPWNRKLMTPVSAQVRLIVAPSLTDSNAPLPTALHLACAAESFFPMDVTYVRWLHSIWPANPDAVLANGAHHFVSEQKSRASTWVERVQTALVQVVQQSPSLESEPALMTLALAMTAGQAAVRSAATDTLIDSIADGRLDPSGLGRMLAVLIEFDYAKVNRFLPMLQEVARVSQVHSKAVTALAGEALSLEREDAPFRFAQLLEFLVEQKFAFPEALSLSEKAIIFLKCLGPNTKAGKLAAKLMSPEG